MNVPHESDPMVPAYLLVKFLPFLPLRAPGRFELIVVLFQDNWWHITYF